MPKDPTKLLQRILVLSALPFFILFLFVWRNVSLKNSDPQTDSGAVVQSGQTNLPDTDTPDTPNTPDTSDQTGEVVSITENTTPSAEEDTLAQIEEQVQLENADGTSVKDAELLEGPPDMKLTVEREGAEVPEMSHSTDASAWTGTTGTGGSAYRTGEGKTHYLNKQTGFTFSMPISYYYTNFGSDGTATLRVGLKSAASPESMADADVVVYFYPNGNPNATEKPDTTNDILYVQVGKASLAIHGYSKDRDLTNSILNSATVQAE